MERRRVLRACSLGGGIALGAGIALWALCSPTSVGCATNVVVLTGGRVTARGCAAYSVAAHVGVGLLVLGAVLLLGRFLLARAGRAAAAATEEPLVPARVDEAVAAPVVDLGTGRTEVHVNGVNGTNGANGTRRHLEPVARLDDGGSAADGRDGAPDTGYRDRRRDEQSAAPLVGLPPGWYGNPDNPGGAVQWWDGARLVDERPSA